MPSEDLPGQDVPSIQRYLGAARVQYERHLLGNERVSEAGYLTEDRVGDAQEFYESRTPSAS